MEYNEYQPTSKFSKYIECFWVLKGTIATIGFVQEALVPGGRSEIIFTDSTFLWYGEDKTSSPTLFNNSFLLGQRASANFIGMKGDYNCFGVRLKIGCLSLFTNQFAQILSNKALPLEEAFEQPIHFQDILSAKNITDAIHTIESWLDQIFNAPDANWEIVQELIRQYSSNGDKKILIKEFSLEYQWSYKKMERMFLKYTGLTPRTVIRILRFREIMAGMKSKPENLTSSAFQFGFYDQSHFIKEFHTFTGTNPTTFYKNLPEIASLLYKLEH